MRKLFRIFFVLLLLGLGLVATGWMTCGFSSCPSLALGEARPPDEGVSLRDSKGREIARLQRDSAQGIKLDSLPSHVPAAFLAVEDQRFYDHWGIDFRRIFGAAWQNLKAGGVAEGGSTITMQLARTLYPDRLPQTEKTIRRKVSEMRMARKLESRYSKDEILELYLNRIYFGERSWGIEEAARTYFGKSAAELDTAEAALLAGVPQAPSRNNPRENLEAALERRRTVLRRMAEMGVIGEADVERLAKAEVELARSRPRRTSGDYFVQAVQDQLEDRFGQAMYEEGWVVHTTLDLAAQRQAEGLFRRHLGAMGKEVQGAAIFLDPESGDVLLWIGGTDYQDAPFDRVRRAHRQVGSLFKPIIYLNAIERGYPLTTRLGDQPTTYLVGGTRWSPRNYNDSYGTSLTLREALRGSHNIATINLGLHLGIPSVLQTAARLGVVSDLPRTPSVLLGSGEMTPLEVARLYGAFASGGRVTPRLIRRVEGLRGEIVWDNPSESVPVVEAGPRFLLTNLLQDVVAQGTGTRVRQSGVRGALAGKTGTTDQGTDAWFAGYSPGIAGVVWLGYDQPASLGSEATGGRSAAPLWGQLFATLSSHVKAEGWSAPSEVERLPVSAEGRALPPSCAHVPPVGQEWWLRSAVIWDPCIPPVSPYPAYPGEGAGYPYPDTLLYPGGGTGVPVPGGVPYEERSPYEERPPAGEPWPGEGRPLPPGSANPPPGGQTGPPPRSPGERPRPPSASDPRLRPAPSPPPREERPLPSPPLLGEPVRPDTTGSG